MSDRIQTERMRLDRERAAGILSDDEYAAATARLSVRAAEQDPSQPVSSEGEGVNWTDVTPPRKRNGGRRWVPWTALALGIVAASGLGAWYAYGAFQPNRSISRDEAPATPASPLNGVAPPATVAAPPPEQRDLRALSQGEQNAAALTTLFGDGTGGETDEAGRRFRYGPGQMVWPSFGPVLLTVGQGLDGGGNVLGVFYLRQNGDQLAAGPSWPQLTGLDPAAGIRRGGAGGDKVAGGWKLSWRYGDYPVIEVETRQPVAIDPGEVEHGIVTSQCRTLLLIELQPGGPLPVARIALGREAASGRAGAPMARIISVERNRALTVRYDGPDAREERYVKTSGVYQPLDGGGPGPC